MAKILSKDNLSKAIDTFHFNGLINLARDVFIKDLKILAYHRVCNLDECYDNDIDLISATESQFDWQINYLKNNFDLISFEDLGNIIDQKIKKPKRPVIITFDDGFTDNYTKAYPILKKHNASATFFVSTDYIGTKNNFWFNQVFRSFLNKDHSHVSIEKFDMNFDLSSISQERYDQIYSIVTALQRCSNIERLEVMDYIENTYPSQDADDSLSLPMTWEQLKEMSDDMEIGSHTAGHPILSTLSEDEFHHEIGGSKEVIENKLNKEITTIAYPVGMPFTYNDRVLKEVNKAKYTFGTSYMPGINYFNTLNRFELKRIHIERYTSNSMFKSMLSFPELFSVY